MRINTFKSLSITIHDLVLLSTGIIHFYALTYEPTLSNVLITSGEHITINNKYDFTRRLNNLHLRHFGHIGMQLEVNPLKTKLLLFGLERFISEVAVEIVVVEAVELLIVVDDVFPVNGVIVVSMAWVFDSVVVVFILS